MYLSNSSHFLKIISKTVVHPEVLSYRLKKIYHRYPMRCELRGFDPTGTME